jgi:hypothetical protein
MSLAQKKQKAISVSMGTCLPVFFIFDSNKRALMVKNGTLFLCKKNGLYQSLFSIFVSFDNDDTSVIWLLLRFQSLQVGQFG